MKKCIAMLLATVMIIAGLLQASATELLFINADDERYYDILTRLGVFSLYQDEEGFFDGAKEVTRAEAATAIVDLVDITPGYDSNVRKIFIDVLPGDPASSSIVAMYSMGAMVGSGDNLFRPYDSIQTVGFVKALLVALGYQWRADIAGGYPGGYLKIANEIELLKGVSIQDGQPLTRSVMFQILYNALSVQVYDVVGVSKDSTLYATSKETTLLAQYHNIYEETAVVNSNSMTSLNTSFKPNEKSVLIGTERVYLQDDKNIWSHLGQNVTYFYKQEEDSGKKILISFAVDDNEIVTLTESTIDSIGSNTIEYLEAETGKIRKLLYGIGTDVIYNGVRDTVDLQVTLNNFSGSADFIDNDVDGEVDVVIISNYHYDAVHSTDLIDEIIYLNGESINLDAAESWVIESATGNVLTLEELAAGDILAIATSADGNLVRLKRLSSAITGKVTQRGAESITVDETSYKVSFGCNAESLARVKLGSQYSFILNQAGEIVYVTDASADGLKTGYLVTYGQANDAFGSKIFLKVLTTSGIEILETREKLQVNDGFVESKNVISTLKVLKNHLNLASDGEVSQVIRYRQDSEGLVSAIYTARKEDNDYLVLKLNTEGDKAFLREGYGVGRLDDQYFIGTNTTIFQVPLTDQETYDDDYYFSVKLKNELSDGNSYILETYTIGDSVMPAVAVCYNTSVAGFEQNADLFLVDSVERTVNADGETVHRLTGYVGGERVSYDSDSQVDIAGLSKGDAVVLKLTATKQFKGWAKVYDASDKEFGIDPDSSESYESTTLSGKRQIMLMSVYRREGGFIEATNKGLEDLEVAFGSMYALDMTRTGNIAVYDSEKDEVSVVTTDAIIDYVRDSSRYTKMLIRYKSGFLMNCIIYK